EPFTFFFVAGNDPQTSPHFRDCSLLVRGGGYLVDFYVINLFYFDPPYVNHLLMLFLKYE
ncbi:hypothetical protein P3514_34620, partial [Vibrio parahaemolyticus]|nr:hypothetical protein [Vibrio parahaemolyticus]